MEETLGKRISAHRKRLGLTQDRLAELLGVTAQAVSKWENDQSCPDISMLPKLAQTFGITTDALLGLPSEALSCEVITADDEENDRNEPEGINIRNDDISFQYKFGRCGNLFFALWVLLSGGLLLTSNLLERNVGFWDILWPSCLLVFGICGMVRCRFTFMNLGMTLLGSYFLLQSFGCIPAIGVKGLLLPVFLLLYGLSLLADAFRKPKKGGFCVTNGKKTQSSCKNDADAGIFQSSCSFGGKKQLVTLPCLNRGAASLSFGELTVDLRGCQSIKPEAFVEVSCAFGELTVLVPRSCRVKDNTGASFGEVTFSGQPDPDATSTLYLTGSVCFGEIQIRYV